MNETVGQDSREYVNQAIWPERRGEGLWLAGLPRTVPLEGLRVLDFSTLLPGPLASLLLAQAGAHVLKVERPNGGDALRDHPIDFALLNAGKRSLVANLKDPVDRERLWTLVDTADVIIEQFRPGVMTRLGFGFDDVSARNPSVVYCSITGYGQTGSRRDVAGHDLNYVGYSGMLELLDTGQQAGARLPPALVADVGGGSYPAFMNIVLALMSRTAETPAVHLDVAMADNVFPFIYWSLARDPQQLRPGSDRLTGQSPRYNTYPTRDGRTVLVAALEPMFWNRFCAAIGLPEELRDVNADQAAVVRAVSQIIASRDAETWRAILEPADCCCSIAATVAEALADPALHERGILPDGPGSVTLPGPLARQLRTAELGAVPSLGEA